MKTELLPDLDVDLDNEASCTLRLAASRRPICTRPAEWAVVLGCCGGMKIVCHAHLTIPDCVRPKIFICTQCGARRPRAINAWRI